ncbi:MAG: hypothetical protein M1818_001298 [Claussenomyces sp. TS43310]|nr:MAG: hypothetical protein M1818_001298 [Claussenomyces sp. TS43310]
MLSYTLIVALVAACASCTPALVKRASLPPTSSVLLLGNTSSTIPNIYRDGGGGGQVNGLNFLNWADGVTTTGGVPDSENSNWINFTSNSISYSGYDGGGPTAIQDFGTTSPRQQIPYFYENGEGDFITGIWPNENIATLCGGQCGVGFPPVINRTAGGTLLYNTGVNITVSAYGPSVSRPVQSVFSADEPQFGSFCALPDTQGEYLYTFAAINANSPANGLKLARVPIDTPFTRSAYQYWNGAAYTSTIPELDDGGAANVFNFSTSFDTTTYGPSGGDVFFNNYYGVYMIIFGQADAALDNGVYMTYSSSLTDGWATPVTIYRTPSAGQYNYNVHAYPNYDSTGQVIPISWTQYAGSDIYYNAFANVTFS